MVFQLSEFLVLSIIPPFRMEVTMPDAKYLIRITLSAVLLVLALSGPLPAENVVEVPVLAAIRANDRGVFEVMLVWWDQKPQPEPIALEWRNAGVNLKETHLGAIADAFRYAVERTPEVKHTGTVSVQGVAYVPTSSDGPSAGAAMAVGFIAVLKGERIQRGVAMTGTIEPGGRIGPVGSIPDKIRAAAREGYRTILIPTGQLNEPRWNLTGLGLELNVTVKEVSTIDDAYELMTGRRI
jgi:PDZ domain-containing protein